MYAVAISLEIRYETPSGVHQHTLDLDIPWHMPIPLFLKEALPEILRRNRLQLPPARGQTWRLVRLLHGQQVPVLSHTFWGAGVYDGERLLLDSYTLPWPPYRFYLEHALEVEEGAAVSGVAGAERIYLAQPRMLIGRHDWGNRRFVDVSLSHFPQGQRISRKQAYIQYLNDRFVLKDLGSRHGTEVNGRSLRANENHTLLPGDRVVFGRVLAFVFRDDQETVPGDTLREAQKPASVFTKRQKEQQA